MNLMIIRLSAKTNLIEGYNGVIILKGQGGLPSAVITLPPLPNFRRLSITILTNMGVNISYENFGGGLIDRIDEYKLRIYK